MGAVNTLVIHSAGQAYVTNLLEVQGVTGCICMDCTCSSISKYPNVGSCSLNSLLLTSSISIWFEYSGLKVRVQSVSQLMHVHVGAYKLPIYHICTCKYNTY